MKTITKTLAKLLIVAVVAFQTSGCTVMLLAYYLNQPEEQTPVAVELVQAPAPTVEQSTL